MPAQETPSSESVSRPELCPHFGECGGCVSQDVPYETQLARKAAALRDVFAPFWDRPITVTASPIVWHYRNKVDPSFARKRYETAPPPGFERETVLGFKRRGRWFWPLDIGECRIGPEGLDRLLESVRRWAREQGLQAWDYRDGRGLLRALLVRDGKRTGERLVALITRDGEFDHGPFIEAVNSVFPAASIYRGVYRGRADGAFAEEVELLHGAPHIAERMCIPDGESTRALEFRISPMSFFQTNTLATELLYGHIRAWLRKTGATHLYDLYGGAGGIALSCADLVERIWSVENVAAASEDGRANAKANEIENVEFITAEVQKYLHELLNQDGLAPESAVLLDPPRAGMHPKAIKRLLALRPANLLYVSCNPGNFARELPEFLQEYTLTGIEAVDLFPHTPHVEVVAALSSR